MTFAEVAKLVADDFRETMEIHNFETFEEMKQCYWWTSADIKEEVSAILNAISKENGIEVYIDELDGSDVMMNGDSISYRAFAKMFRKAI